MEKRVVRNAVEVASGGDSEGGVTARRASLCGGALTARGRTDGYMYINNMHM